MSNTDINKLLAVALQEYKCTVHSSYSHMHGVHIIIEATPCEMLGQHIIHDVTIPSEDLANITNACTLVKQIIKDARKTFDTSIELFKNHS